VTSFVERLRDGEAIDAPVALVAAHPDDETVGLGSRLGALRRLRLIHLTDGAPRDLGDAHRAGFADASAYAAARETEVECALAALGADAAERIRYGLADQGAVFALAELVERLVRDLAGMAMVVTHAFEHGHPDHDAAALAVALACAALPDPPRRIEFAGYHLAGEREVYGRFRGHPAAPETVLPFDVAACRRKIAALACFRSQAEVLARFPVAPEIVRPAPAYDFTEPIPAGAALYDRWGWNLDSRRWFEAARPCAAAQSADAPDLVLC
jgi:LmbE family N-acetylglucosaminyl deacetylase